MKRPDLPRPRLTPGIVTVTLTPTAGPPRTYALPVDGHGQLERDGLHPDVADRIEIALALSQLRGEYRDDVTGDAYAWSYAAGSALQRCPTAPAAEPDTVPEDHAPRAPPRVHGWTRLQRDRYFYFRGAGLSHGAALRHLDPPPEGN